MTYRISYSAGSAGTANGKHKVRTSQTEEYRTEPEALRRALELLETGEHHGIAVRDHSGNALCGVRLQLR